MASISAEKKNIRHEDLSRMTTKRLNLEFKYLEKHLLIQSINIQGALGLNNHKCYTGDIPAWKLAEDYALIVDRIQAIIEELEYRHIP